MGIQLMRLNIDATSKPATVRVKKSGADAYLSSKITGCKFPALITSTGQAKVHSSYLQDHGIWSGDCYYYFEGGEYEVV